MKKERTFEFESIYPPIDDHSWLGMGLDAEDMETMTVNSYLRALVPPVAVSDFSLHKGLLGADYTWRLLDCSFRDVDTGGAHASAFATRPLGDSDMSTL